MPDVAEIMDLNRLNYDKSRKWPYSKEYCITCGLCASACPASGIEGFDPRQLIRMISLGLEDAILASRWPWICTMCANCEGVCPMEIDIADTVRDVRALCDREKVPGILHKGLTAALETGNNLRLPKEDYVFVLEDVAEELAEEPGFEGFHVPVDKKGANILTTIHNKLVNTHTEDLKHWWKILHVVDEDWTVTSANWEGTSWGYFTGDDNAMKTMVERIYEQMQQLEVRNLLWPE